MPDIAAILESATARQIGAALPAGVDGDGLPFGVTVFAEPGSDELVLNVAAAIEAAIAKDR